MSQEISIQPPSQARFAGIGLLLLGLLFGGIIGYVMASNIATDDNSARDDCAFAFTDDLEELANRGVPSSYVDALNDLTDHLRAETRFLKCYTEAIS